MAPSPAKTAALKQLNSTDAIVAALKKQQDGLRTDFAKARAERQANL
jgi:hypothetical protein